MMKTEHREQINELLDYEAELTDKEFIFVNSIKDYSELSEDLAKKLEKLYDKIFELQEKDTYEIFDET
jgi:L-ribulose-5-phosphate 3-epimerase UlaE